ncbi:hypothetical protein AB4Z10_00120 [Bosea sp. RAF48]|uniref:DUF7696 family protein n=1 Tax=Bosea sp. RAF48 TaxID=3237480 RepID=UPI003F8F0A6C
MLWQLPNLRDSVADGQTISDSTRVCTAGARPSRLFSILSGREVSTWPEQWKHECEIRYFAGMKFGDCNEALHGVKDGLRGITSTARLVVDDQLQYRPGTQPAVQRGGRRRPSSGCASGPNERLIG